MNQSIWKPHVTVAAVVERDGRFLLVEEETRDGIRLNQPAGHLEPDESPIAAVIRETEEETAHRFIPQALIGIYQWTRPGEDDEHFLRFAFCGTVDRHDPSRRLDQGIIAARWLSLEEIRSQPDRLRSPLVMGCILDYLAGSRFSLDLFRTCS